MSCQSLVEFGLVEDYINYERYDERAQVDQRYSSEGTCQKVCMLELLLMNLSGEVSAYPLKTTGFNLMNFNRKSIILA